MAQERLSTRRMRQVRRNPDGVFSNETGDREIRWKSFSNRIIIAQTFQVDGHRAVARGETLTLTDSEQARLQLPALAAIKGCNRRVIQADGC